MVNSNSIGYGALYSFHPDYIRYENDETPTHEDRSEVTYNLDNYDERWSGILLILVLLLMTWLFASLMASPGIESISRHHV